MLEIFNGQRNIGVSEGKLKRFMKRNEIHLITEDCQSILGYFDSIRSKDPGFIYSINLSNNGSLNGIFWVDSEARSSYKLFGDVVVFDTTYKKNRYRWSFGPFTGVNNHGQSTIFRGGLIANEIKESFEWLFRAWLDGMGEKEPKAIITDECTGIVPVVASVFPKKDNYWLRDKFDQKEHWVLCYLKKPFFAGMNSTQCSEGMNSYFQGYFKGTMTLYKFVKQYEKAIARHREKESEAELRTCTQLPQLSSQHPREEHAGKVYTRRIFDIFKKEFISSVILSAKEELNEAGVHSFYVGPFNVPIEHRCKVIYEESKEVVQCGCRLFEFMGVLCKHVLKVLQILDCDAIPAKYILPR
ncbi:protein FAR1-RELATED SEQUENCE 5-like [Macadamia integrifolia]|uniref:protein FAR1-RELATED SEQUENCE 5-like n=1 Tax=Macadamia integrifolia TaxID=60698 RepID=UPI001C52AD20|nr:protein FAR1-RELATED SEQUENCE 5-like [Macadamia integrifolia]